MKKTFKLILTFIFVLTIGIGNIHVFASSNIKVKVNSREITLEGQRPEVIKGVTYVPLRGVLEELGFKVDWNSADSTIVLKLNDETITIYKDSTYKVNAISKKLKNKLITVNNSTMVPFREISELIGAQVNWDSKNKEISIIIKVKPSVESYPSIQEDINDSLEANGVDFLKSYFNILEARTQKTTNLNNEVDMYQHYLNLEEKQKPMYLEKYIEINNEDINLVNQIVAPGELEKIKQDTIALLQSYSETMRRGLAGEDYESIGYIDGMKNYEKDEQISNSIIKYCKENNINYNDLFTDKFENGLIWFY